MKTHHPWWPHLDFEPIFNPFVSIIERWPSGDRIELPETEEEESQQEMKSPDVQSRADK